MQPGRQRLRWTDRGRFPGQDQECSLKGVLCIVGVAQHTPAHVEHQRAVAFDQRGETRLVPVPDETIQ